MYWAPGPPVAVRPTSAFLFGLKWTPSDLLGVLVYVPTIFQSGFTTWFLHLWHLISYIVYIVYVSWFRVCFEDDSTSLARLDMVALQKMTLSGDVIIRARCDSLRLSAELLRESTAALVNDYTDIISCKVVDALSRHQLLELLQELQQQFMQPATDSADPCVEGRVRRRLRLFGLARPQEMQKLLRDMILTPLHVISSAALFAKDQHLTASKICDSIVCEACDMVPADSHFYQERGCHSLFRCKSEVLKVATLEDVRSWIEHDRNMDCQRECALPKVTLRMS